MGKKAFLGIVYLFSILLFHAQENIVNHDSSFATEHIVKVFDTNLFLTESGRLIKMAYLDIPSLASPDSAVRDFSVKIWLYLQKELVDKKISFTNLYSDKDKNLNYVKLEKHKLLNTLDYQRWILHSGYARYQNSIGNYNDQLEYLELSEKTSEKKYGLWREEFSKNERELDPHLSLTEFRMKADGFLQTKIDACKIPEINAGEVMGRTFMGLVGMGLGGFLGGLSGGLIGMAQDSRSWDVLAYVGWGMILGSFIGTPSGVYLKAKHADPNLSYGETIFASLVGTGAGVLIGLIASEGNKEGGGYLAVPVFQLAAAVIYSSSMSPSLKMPAVPPELYRIKKNLQHNERISDFNVSLISLSF